MSAGPIPALAEIAERRRTMARVGHLVRRKQVEIERAVRLLRAHFIDRRSRAPKCGTIHRIVLVGPFARPRARPDRETGDINDYNIWAFVDHPAYKGMNRYLGARQTRRCIEPARSCDDHLVRLHARRDRTIARGRQPLPDRPI